MKFNGLRLERVRASPQFDGRHFCNTGVTLNLDLVAGVRLLPELLLNGYKRRPKQSLPLVRPHEAWLRPAGTGLRTTWLGHSTVLIELDGRKILTDPVFSARASPFSFAGPKRFHPTPATLTELPPLDAVVLSHDHYDHLCASTIAGIARMPGVPIITALGVGARLERMGVPPYRIYELDWGETCDLQGLRFIATPSQHSSGRGVADQDATLWSSWVIQSDSHRVFFSGDTGLTEHFCDIGEMYGPFDIVIIEIGAFHPNYAAFHLGPDNALKAFNKLGGGTLLPVHWGTFDLALHAWYEPPETLVRLATEQGVRVITPSLGEVIEPSQVDGPTCWWRNLELGVPHMP
ncbi:hypothetical protein EA797_20565 [Stutzerimonas zhaodongensis]|uniref:Metallo-beta-lactamase domain-containing protein n=2 Tax=Stutzerimonas zhaodongensis TaxID=1176257 RepID=A0A3M2HN59_9GAMM|nr:hypothetical protein EA797_20565 [Stutzerimonas zhaodongensis]